MKSKKDKEILDALSLYIAECKNGKGVGEKNGKRVPNVSGLCRFMSIGKRELLSKLSNKPILADRLFTIFEDEAINTDASSSAISHYIKIIDDLREELDGGERKDDEKLTVIFEHEDGEEE